MRSCNHLLCLTIILMAGIAHAHESVWLKAEHMGGIKGYCWPIAPVISRCPRRGICARFGDKGFRYLWNVVDQHALETWLSDDPKTVLFPYTIRD